MTQRPRPSTTVTPAGMVQRPAQSILPSRSTIVAFGTAAAPVPSTSVAPTIARAGGGVPGGVGNALVTAILQPFGVLTKTRSETPVCSSDP